MSIALLPHVEEPKLSALHTRLVLISKLSADFLVFLSGSTVIATFGLFQNSPAVIIGAMIIAPLMRPLAGLSLATLTADTRLLFRSLSTLLVGTVVGVLISLFMTSFLKSLQLTPEILSRTHPTLLDLGVALTAGAVGAYCQAKEELADTLAGVAIAVALVPPLCVIGIGLALNDLPVWSGAALLYATNLIGITVAGSFVFLLMGFTPLKQAKRGLATSAAVTLVLIIPLALSMRELVLENQIGSKIVYILKEKTFTFRDVELHDVDVKRFRTPMSVVATVLASGQPITAHQVGLVEKFLSKEMRMPIEFKLRIIPATELTAIEVSKEGELPAASSTGTAVSGEHVTNTGAQQVPEKVESAEIPDSSSQALPQEQNIENSGQKAESTEKALEKLEKTADLSQAKDLAKMPDPEKRAKNNDSAGHIYNNAGTDAPSEKKSKKTVAVEATQETQARAQDTNADNEPSDRIPEPVESKAKEVKLTKLPDYLQQKTRKQKNSTPDKLNREAMPESGEAVKTAQDAAMQAAGFTEKNAERAAQDAESLERQLKDRKSR